MEDFLTDCKKIQAMNLGKEEFGKKIAELKEAVIKRKNPYIEALLSNVL